MRHPRARHDHPGKVVSCSMKTHEHVGFFSSDQAPHHLFPSMAFNPQSLSSRTLAAPARHGFVRVVFCLATLFLMLQLFCMAFHRHALTEQVSDCVSCYSACQLSGGTTEPILKIAAAPVVVYRQPILIALSQPILADHFLLPPAHAPPAVS